MMKNPARDRREYRNFHSVRSEYRNSRCLIKLLVVAFGRKSSETFPDPRCNNVLLMTTATRVDSTSAFVMDVAVY